MLRGVLFLNDKEPVQFMSTLGDQFKSLFRRRKTYIIPLEMAAVTVALRMFATELRGARVTFYIDNAPVKCCLRKHRCKVEDVNRLLLFTIDIMEELGVVPNFKWVPSAWNVADGPSRGVPVKGARLLSCSRSVREVLEGLREVAA